MPDDPEFDRPDNFFGKLITEKCGCGHRLNVTEPADHTCSPECSCPGCRATINRQLRVMEED
jgi:hypothetical protein